MSWLRRLEGGLAGAALLAMVVLPLVEVVARACGTFGFPGSVDLVRHLTLWVGFLGAALAASEGKLLSFGRPQLGKVPANGGAARLVASTVAAGIGALLTVAAVELVRFEYQGGTRVTTWLPAWIAQLAIPVGLALITLRLTWRAGGSVWPRLVAGVGALAGLLLGLFPGWLEGRPLWPVALVLVAGTLLGAPIFTAIGGLAALLFMREGIPPVAVLVETYRLSVSPTLAAIPLFTLVGFVLARGGAAGRLLRVFRASVGWMPGGTAVVCALSCAFFTAPTGGSGVTILALGGLLFQALHADRYRDRFSLGLLTASGSLGLLFPPALPLILYGIVAETPIDELFLAGLLPGLLLVGLVTAWGIREGLRSNVPRTRPDRGEVRSALWEARGELLIPVVAIGAIFSGFATLVEAAALTAVFAFATQSWLHRELSLRRDLPQVLRECLVLLGGVLLILGVAMGLTSYLVDAQIPAAMLEGVQSRIESPLLLLLSLNLFLLAVGCVMDIFSATVVVVPMITPLAAAYGIDPAHLAIIFVANLELGYLTPPVGLNLFMSAYRFERPIFEVYRAALVPLAILAAGVLLITYFPPLTLGLLTLLGHR